MPLDTAHPAHNLPPRNYATFVGRDAEYDQLRQMLLPYPQSRYYFVAIDGIGGIGKSSLVLETAYRYCESYASADPAERFDAIVWVSAKRTSLTPSGVIKQPQAFSTLTDLFASIALVLRLPEIIKARPDEQRGLIEQALSSTRTLLILDNMETVDAEEWLEFARSVPDPTKIIITSRHRIDGAYVIRLTGMPHADAFQLMEQEASVKGVTITFDDQAAIWEHTAGSPLSIVWCISLMASGRPLNHVLRQLDQAETDITSFLRQYIEDRPRPLLEAKLILVGEGTVGKTSLVKRLMYDRYDPAESKTEGIAIERWPLLLDRDEVRLNVWDFAGQEITHATHQFFLTRRTMYLLVLNCRASDHDNRLDYWLKLVQSFAPDSPVIVVGNKVDQHPLDLDQRGLMLKYPQIQGFVATSCENGAGIAELRDQIVRQLGEMKHIRDVLPTSWWSVKRQLETSQEDYISLERFKSLCLNEGIDDPFGQTVLLGLLNDLGTVLSYHDDPRLAETNVLNPEWVTNGVYTLLNHAPLLDQRSGILSDGELTRILSKYGDRYPATKCHFISEMMEKFELCFRIERGRWLIPDLLPKEEPDSGAWDDTLHFVYRYPVLPSSIIARFIVRWQHAIEGALRWRTGVVLKSSENRAFVKADPESARIDIRIGGDPANRRRLLSAIRHTFEQIHSSLSGLHPEIKEFVPLPGFPDDLVNYDELLGLEEMGARDYQSGLLRRIFPLAQLLDGYESATQRQARQVDRYDDAPLEHLQALLQTSQDHLRTYELQKADFGGLHVPPYITRQIAQLVDEIERIREAMERRRLRGGR